MAIASWIIFAFLLIALFLGIQAKKGKEMNIEQWAVGGRGFGSIFVFILLAGEGYSTFTLLGASGWAYSKGAPTYYVLAYTAFAFMIGYWLLPPIWKYAKQHGLVSQADFFVSKYNSKALGTLVSIVGIIAMVPYLIVQFKGLGIIVSETSYGMISPNLAVVLGVIALTVYVMVSGVHGSAWTAVLKDVIVFGVIVFLGLYLPFHYYGGLREMFESVSAAKENYLLFPDKGLSSSWYVSTVLLFTLGLYMWPHCLVPVFSAKNTDTFRKNAIMMPLYTLMLLFVFFVGYTAIGQVPGLEGAEGDLSLLRLAIKTFDPWFVGIIGAVGLLSALVLGSILLMSSATTLANNIFKLFVPNASDKQIGKTAKLCVPLISLICLYYTLGDSNSLTTLFLSGYTLVTQFFPAFFCSLWKRNPITKQGAFAGILVGGGIVLYTTSAKLTMASFFPSSPQFIQDLNIGALAFVLNIVAMVAVSMLTRNRASAAQATSEV